MNTRYKQRRKATKMLWWAVLDNSTVSRLLAKQNFGIEDYWKFDLSGKPLNYFKGDDN